ncbi:giant nuclei [Musca autumnalis]|uniref:giant nuclei n=1 Tax=Musca autumnalis TaxID=221902 RepID=UPI003CE70C64
MERYAYLQSMPNSPLSPLTPLSENTTFDFNFGGDGSLDEYIESIREKHRMEQQQPPTAQIKPRTDSPLRPRPRYSEHFRKIRDIFEKQEEKQNVVPLKRIHLKDPPKTAATAHCCQQKQQHSELHSQKQQKVPPTSQLPHSFQKRPIITIVSADQKNTLPQEYVATPTNVRTPLKQRNHNVMSILTPKLALRQQNEHHQKLKILQNKAATFLQPQQQQQQQRQHHRMTMAPSQQKLHFRQASPVAIKPLCPHISKILHQIGLSIYNCIFQREEIDLFAFKMLTAPDLQQMGIKNTNHCDLIMAEVCYARQYY